MGVTYSKKIDDIDHPKYLFHIGGYYRLNDAVIPVIKLEASPFTFSASYDANISNLKKVSTGNGGYEFSIAFQQYKNKDNSSREATKCPKF